MPVINLETPINAPISICFNLSRSIDLHMVTTHKTKECAIAGRKSGLIELNETVTWRAKHLGTWHILTSRITVLCYPTFFVDEMVKGAFHSFRHEHAFRQEGQQTIMTDKFIFTTPLGWLGKLANTLFLTKYMTRFLQERNDVIKEYAETDKWKAFLKS